MLVVVVVVVTGFCGNRYVVIEALSEEGEACVQHVASADDIMTLIREDLHRGERGQRDERTKSKAASQFRRCEVCVRGKRVER